MNKEETLVFINSLLEQDASKWSDLVEKHSDFFEEHYPAAYAEYQEAMETCDKEELDSFLTHPAVDLFNDIKFALKA